MKAVENIRSTGADKFDWYKVFNIYLNYFVI